VPAPGAQTIRSGVVMTNATRRGFLTTAGLGTAAGVVAFAVGSESAEAVEPALPADAEGAMVAYIRDVQKGELTLMVEGHEVLVTDKKLVTRLAAAFARARG
jgi:hypothetical protein